MAMQLECLTVIGILNSKTKVNNMITITNHVFLEGVQCTETIECETFEEYVLYLEYHKNSV